MAEQDTESWDVAARAYLARLGQAEWNAQRDAHKRLRRSLKTLRYAPSDYHRSLIDRLNAGDEEGFKALKHLQGYMSALGV